jgi:hypothetical protein
MLGFKSYVIYNKGRPERGKGEAKVAKFPRLKVAPNNNLVNKLYCQIVSQESKVTFVQLTFLGNPETSHYP